MLEYKKGDVMKLKRIKIKNYLSKSSLPSYDYTINPYVGCSHGCKYCYASYMKKYSGHEEPWGKFLDIKYCDNAIALDKLIHKRVFMSSVTDCYNMYEGRYLITRKILEQLVDVDCSLTITTKSKLIIRDIELLKRCKDVTVAISINTLDEQFKKDMDHASSIKDRILALQKLHAEGIRTVIFLSPIFPGITDAKAIMKVTKDFVDEYWLEDLSLRGPYKKDILQYIKVKYPNWYSLYQDIYVHHDYTYVHTLMEDLQKYAKNHNIAFQNYFHHQ